MIIFFSAQNLRNHLQINLNFNKKIVIIKGKNGTGKTTILEGIYFSIFKKSFKTNEQNDLIKKDQLTSYVENITVYDGIIYKISGILNKDKANELKLNGLPISTKELRNIINPLVIDSKLINDFKNNKKARQALIDKLISTDIKIYHYQLQEFIKLKKLLLQTLIEKPNERSIIVGTKDYLADIEKEIIENRTLFINKVNLTFEKNTKAIIKKDLKIKYLPMVIIKEIKKNLDAPYPITCSKDDYIILEGETNYFKFASEGEIRIVILLLIISYLEIINKEYNQLFPLLLDDVFSELDAKHSNILLETLLKKEINAFLTTTSMHKIKTMFLDEIEIINL